MKINLFTSTFRLSLKLVGKILLLIILVLIVNQIIYFIINPTYSWGSDKIHRKRMYLKPMKNEFNTFFIGDSKIGQSIMPNEFDSLVNLKLTESPLKSFNYGIGSMAPPESYFVLEQMLTSDSIHPEYVIMQLYDINIVGPRLIHTRRSIYWYTPEYYWFTVKTLLWSKDKIGRRLEALKNHSISYLEKLFNMGFLSDYYDFTILEKQLDLNIKEEGFFSMDFSDNPDVVKQHQLFLNDSTNLLKMREISLGQNYSESDISAYNKVHLNKINELIDFCEKHGTHLIFLLSPNMGKKNDIVIPIFNRIDPLHRIELSDAKKYPEFYETRYSYDGKHFNSEGATIFTRLLSEKFLNIVEQSHRNNSTKNRKQ